MTISRNGWMALAAPVCLAASTTALGAGSDADQSARLAQLEQTVAQLRAEQNEGWLNEQRTEEVRSIVQDVLADADTRASLLQGGGGAGYDGGFFIKSPDGNWSIKLNGLAQVRFVYNNFDEAGGDSSRWGFENTRTRLTFSGNVVDSSWLYTVMGNFARDTGTFTLEDAWIAKVLDGGWIFIAGQVEVPMTREEAVDDPHQLFLERSLIDQEFSPAYTQGVALAHMGEQLHAVFAVTDGHSATGAGNTTWDTYNTELSLTARAEYLVSGSWDQFKDQTSPRGSENGILVGAAIHWQNGEYGTMADEIEALQWTVDGSFEFDGANIMAAFTGRSLSGALDNDIYGFVVQGGYYLADDWEIVGRFEWGDDDVDATDELMIITVGANHYISGNNVRWSSDIGFALNEVASTWGDGSLGAGGSPAGWRTDAADEDGQMVFRSQLQIAF